MKKVYQTYQDIPFFWVGFRLVFFGTLFVLSLLSILVIFLLSILVSWKYIFFIILSSGLATIFNYLIPDIKVESDGEEGRPKGSKNKPKIPVVLCECDDDTLIKTAYWWSKREWIYLHPGRDAHEYQKYLNACTGQLKEYFGIAKDYLLKPNHKNVMNNEVIVCSAIEVSGVNEKLDDIYLGPRHVHCFAAMTKRRSLVGMNRDEYRIAMLNHNTQGFLTNLNRFVDRQEAYLIAETQNQIKHKFNKRVLYSECLY